MAINYRTGLTAQQKTSVDNLINSGRAFGETDARNYAYATNAGDFKQFLGKTGLEVTNPSPATPSVLDASTLNQPQIQLPQTQEPADPSGFVFSTQQLLKQYNDAQARSFELENSNTEIQKRLMDTLNNQKSSAQIYQEQADKVQLEAKRKQLEEMNLQISQKTGEFDKAVAGLEGQGRGITTGIITGQQGAIRRQQAAEIGALASVQQALQGNYALAQQTAEKAVQLEFADQESKINNLKTALEMNYQNFSTAEKRRADQLNLILDQQKQQMEQTKASRTQVLAFVTEAAKNGADNNTLNRMAKATTPEEALGLGGSFIGKLEREKFEIDRQMAQLDMSYKKAQISDIYSGIEKRKSEMNPQGDNSETLSLLQLTNDILGSKYLDSVVGFPNPFLAYTPGSPAQYVKNQLDQLKNSLSLDNRQKLKGSGAISDFEARMLSSASSALGKNLSNVDTKRELAKIKGVFQTSAGLQAMVEITDPKTGNKKQGALDRNGIDGALASGYLVEYK